jgi:hypothetical protein
MATINGVAGCGHTTIIHRRGDVVTNYREFTDSAARIAVRVFPFAAAAGTAKTEKLSAAGVYLLSNADAVYVGQSRDPGERVVEHTADKEKGFATEVYVIAAFDGPELDRPDIEYLEARLTEMAVAAQRVHVLNEVEPNPGNLHYSRVTSLEHMLADALRLLYDAGCRIFEGCDPPRLELVQSGNGPGPNEALNHAANIGIARLPAGVQGFELHYTGITARGYRSADGFIVVQGSEFRATVNDSTQQLTSERHNLLKQKRLLVPIPGVDDRLRLAAAVEFPTVATAAKVVCGAHVGASKWVPLPNRPVVVID